MGQQQSKDESLYQQASCGNIEGIKALHREGAGLEYKDREGKTALIVACSSPALFSVAQTLIELGANVNAYRSGPNGGTPLHHAAKCGLDHVVTLLLLYGANAPSINDDFQTPFDIAKAKGYSKVVLAIETIKGGHLPRKISRPHPTQVVHQDQYLGVKLIDSQYLAKLPEVEIYSAPVASKVIRPQKRYKSRGMVPWDMSYKCLYSGWLRELYGPRFLEIFAPHLFSKKVWVLVVACVSHSLGKHFKLGLVIYSDIQDTRPCKKVALWRACMEEPSFNQPDPSVIITESSTCTRIKFTALEESDKQQLQRFCSACKGIPQVMHSDFFPFNTTTPAHPSTTPAAAATEVPPVPKNTTTPAPEEDTELAMAINASLQSAMEEGMPLDHLRGPNEASSSCTVFHSGSSNSQVVLPPKKASCSDYHQLIEEGETSSSSAIATSSATATSMAVPSAPALTNEVLTQDPISYPTIDSGILDLARNHNNSEHGSKRLESSLCVICFDTPVEGACVPCGHMAGCMLCLNEIKAKKWGCPVCRTNIDQVIKLFSV